MYKPRLKPLATKPRGQVPAPTDYALSLESVVLVHCAAVLRACQGNQSQAATILRISRGTLIDKIRRMKEIDLLHELVDADGDAAWELAPDAAAEDRA